MGHNHFPVAQDFTRGPSETFAAVSVRDATAFGREPGDVRWNARLPHHGARRASRPGGRTPWRRHRGVPARTQGRIRSITPGKSGFPHYVTPVYGPRTGAEPNRPRLGDRAAPEHSRTGGGRGTATVGVQRQSPPAATRPGGPPGIAGRIENAQVAVYLAYTTRAGHALIDRRLYLPRSWTEEPERLQTARVPDSIGFATKPELAHHMITNARTNGTPATWVAADEVHGHPPAAPSSGATPGRLRGGRATHRTHQPAPRAGHGRRTGGAHTRLCLAAALGRRRGRRPALLRLGPDRRRDV
ncbi:transposase [Nocardiopsis kunsanensis]|uniref:transposase n=1 Tax=Nocardiopsis kunsanensis TaxID=141693 RepID=UPI000A075CB0